MYKISLINICDIKEHEIILNNYFIKKSEISIFKKVIERLKKQEPIEYIFNNTCFLNNKIVLNNHVFIPRPETEELVDWILKEEKEKENLKIVDVCTGSGCIALSLGKKTKHEIIAVEKSIHAVKIAKQNFEIHDLSNIIGSTPFNNQFVNSIRPPLKRPNSIFSSFMFITISFCRFVVLDAILNNAILQLEKLLNDLNTLPYCIGRWIRTKTFSFF